MTVRYYHRYQLRCGPKRAANPKDLQAWREDTIQELADIDQNCQRLVVTLIAGTRSKMDWAIGRFFKRFWRTG